NVASIVAGGPAAVNVTRPLPIVTAAGRGERHEVLSAEILTRPMPSPWSTAVASRGAGQRSRSSNHYRRAASTAVASRGAGQRGVDRDGSPAAVNVTRSLPIVTAAGRGERH